MRKSTYAALFAAIVIAACGGGEVSDNASTASVGDGCAIGEYESDVTYPVASFNEKWANKPRMIASGFLVNREKGIFMTARHYFDGIEKMGRSESTMFFNGKVYPVVVHRGTQLLDIGLVRINCDSFDSSDFPDPFPIAQNTVEVGDRVFAMGIHWHPNWLMEENDSIGRPDLHVPIFRDHYEMIRVGRNARKYVFDRVPGTVDEINASKPIDVDLAHDPRWQERRNELNVFHCMKADYEHQISFGGLSGGPFVNRNNELVGVVSRGAVQMTDNLCFVPVHNGEFQRILREALM